MEQVSFSYVFEKQKSAIKDKLGILFSANDCVEAQTNLNYFIADMLKSDGELSQSLTRTEEFVIQSALELLVSQQDLDISITSDILSQISTKRVIGHYWPTILSCVINGATGLFIGKIVESKCAIELAQNAIRCPNLGTWGMAFGVLTSVLTVKILSINNRPKLQKLDICKYIDKLEQICKRFDDLLNTFRAQEYNIKAAYKPQEEKMFMNEYPSIAESIEDIQSILSNSELDDTNKVSSIEVKMRLMLAKMENYGVKYANGKLIYM